MNKFNEKGALSEVNGLHEIGPQLRAAREAREISLDLAEEETKIRKKYLLALENGTPEVIPGDVYVRGFLRSYANWLGLDGPALVDAYKERNGESVEPVAVGVGPVERTEQPAPILRRKERHKPGISSRPFLVVGGILAVVVAGYLIYRGLGSPLPQIPVTGAQTEGNNNTPNTQSPPTTETPPTTSEGSNAGSNSGTPTPSSPASTDPAPGKVKMNPPRGELVLFDVTGTGPIDVALQFEPRAQVWMQITVDGKVIGQQNVTDPAKTQWRGNSIEIRLGNAESLESIKVNGESFTRPLKGGPFTLRFAPHT